MNHSVKSIFAKLQPDGNGYQVSYETENSRKVHCFGNTSPTSEKPPHGAGSFHDPEQHQILMERIEDHIKKIRS